MSDPARDAMIAALRSRMEAAAAATDFEEAQRLRDRIAFLRDGGDPAQAEAVADAGLARQQPGAMGLGTSRQRVVPPADWVRPKKPDPMTRATGRKRRED